MSMTNAIGGTNILDQVAKSLQAGGRPDIVNMIRKTSQTRGHRRYGMAGF